MHAPVRKGTNHDRDYFDGRTGAFPRWISTQSTAVDAAVCADFRVILRTVHHTKTEGTEEAPADAAIPQEGR